MRVDNPKQSKLIRGLNKVIDRQNNKPAVVKIDIGMNTYKEYKNRSTYETSKLGDFYYPLLWHPLKYVIKRTAHTYYTYSVSALPFAKDVIRRMNRKYKKTK